MIAVAIGLLDRHVLGLDASAFVHMLSMLTAEVNKTAAVSIPQLVTSLIPTNIFLILRGQKCFRYRHRYLHAISGIAPVKGRAAPEEGLKLSAGINAGPDSGREDGTYRYCINALWRHSIRLPYFHHTALNNSPAYGFIGASLHRDFHDVYRARHFADPQR